MTAEKFWTGWLKVTMLLMTMAGTLLLTTYYSGHTDFIDAKFEQAFQGKEVTPEEIEQQKKWMIPMVGSIMISWSLCMLYVAGHAFKQRKKWAWYSLFYPILFWFIIDSASSIIYGVYFDLAVNFILFFQLAAPLLFLRTQFFPPKEGIA